MADVRNLAEIIEQEQKLEIEKSMALKNALNSDDVNKVYQASKYLQSIHKRDEFGGKSMLVDPQSPYSQGGYREKSFSMSNNVLRGMAGTDIIKAAHNTRKSQISNFLEPQRDKYSTGFVIEKKKNQLQNQKVEKLSKAEEKRIEYLTKFLLDCGTTQNIWHGDSFETFVSKVMDDSLTLDQGCAEIKRNRKGEPIEYFAIDAGMIRLAETYWGDPQGKYKELELQGYYPSHVQIYQNNVIAQYYPWEIMYGVRNHSTNIERNGYGESELEKMIQTVTSILNANYYNANFFKVGSAPKGILKYSGNINQNTVDEFRRQWQSQLAGVDGMHKMAIINADKMDFINTQMSNKDMEFGQFQDFLIKIICAIYLIDPAEIGFPMQGSSQGGGAMFEGSNEMRLKWSKDKGLKPLLKALQKWINKWIISQLDPEYVFKFVGIDDEIDAEKELDGDIKALSNFMTPNEIREKRNLSPIEGGDIILNPVFMQGKQLASMGDPNANAAVDDMEKENQSVEADNPFMEALQKSLVESLQ